MKIPDILLPGNEALRSKCDVLLCEHCRTRGFRCPACVSLPITGYSRYVMAGLVKCCDFEYDGSMEQLFLFDL